MTVLTQHHDRPVDAHPEDDPATAPRPGVVERMTQILDLFLAHDGYHRLEDISAGTGLPRSTTFRLLSQLVTLRWLEHDAHGYRVGGRVLGMTARATDHGELRSAAADLLNELHARTGAVAHLGVLDDASVRYLDKIGGRASPTLPSRVGGRLPAHRTVLGRALLACLPAERVDALLAADPAPGHPRPDLPRLHAQLHQIRLRNGVSAHEVHKLGPDVTAVAVPVRGPDGAIAAISLAGRGSLRLDSMIPLVVAAARRTSQLMFPHWEPQHAAPTTRSRAAG
ncbi:putative HTH-type transcriptional regulator RhmR [Nocardioides dokdonensis FR1436]|uniref:Putative HTH-type transcriptional regulator RhmR n=1 Tax=Nocardioides dokdonensis FR1436 TaxID=1300347 RepID=A0A1A9GG75_9ACTN|nr:putative HTH-type transcriptional regulator RhmR [Nocardioides dokdonensis FR1436]